MELCKMKYYIGCKQIQAEKQIKDGQEGYKVVYPDGYVSWSPKEVFEQAYLPLGSPDGSTIDRNLVENFIKEVKSYTIGDKTTVTQVTLINGFVITKSSSCVDPKNYSQSLGEELNVEHTEDDIWGLLGFLLQSCRYGFSDN